MEGSAPVWSLPQDAAATADDPAMAFIMQAWPLLAAEAWEGYQRRGRGLLILNSCRYYDYRTRTPCEWDNQELPDYDPERNRSRNDLTVDDGKLDHQQVACGIVGVHESVPICAVNVSAEMGQSFGESLPLGVRFQ